MESIDATDHLGPDFDHKDAESAENPLPRWKHLRENEPVTTSNHYGGFHVVSRYDDVSAAARNYKVFSSADTATLPQRPDPHSPPIDYDPPVQRAYRLLLNPWFSPAKVATYQPWIDALAADLLAPLIKRGEFDLTIDFALPLGEHTICNILGISDPPAELHRWVDDLINYRGIDNDRVMKASLAFRAYLEKEIRDRQEHPRHDLIGSVCQAEIDGSRLELKELIPMVRLLVSAGLETTATTISGCIWYLLQHREVAEEMRSSGASTWDHAMEEFVRWTSPAQGVTRTVHEDTELRGCPMRTGDKVFLLVGSANRDESEFPNPDDVDLERFPNRHLGFGLGPHRCLGSHLAKAMMRAGLRELVEILPNWELGDPAKVRWAGAEVRGLKNLPLVRRPL